MYENGPIIVEGLLVGGGVIGWCLWELRSLAKLKRAQEAAERAEQKAGADAAAGKDGR